MITLETSQAPLVNSTTYADLLGLLAGLQRAPGEPARAFAGRLRQAAQFQRTPDYEGLINELCLQFGLTLTPALSLAGPADLTVTVDLLGVHLASALDSWSFSVPLQTIAPDLFWEWRSLSDLVAAINQTGVVSSQLLVPDALAVTLPKQTNLGLALAEPIEGQTVRLTQAGFLLGSETFSAPVPAYSYTGGAVLHFSAALPPGLSITYRYRVSPYRILSCPVNLVSLSDPQFGTLSTCTNSQLTYQCREYLEEILRVDGSYWAP